MQLKRTSYMSLKEPETYLSTPSRSRSPALGLAIERSTAEIRRFGPRSPSPLPTSPAPSRPRELSEEEVESDLEDDTFEFVESSTGGLQYSTPEPFPRSKRQPFMSTSLDVATPSTPISVNNIEPLSIKKKSSIRSGHNVYTSPRKSFRRMSPLSKPGARIISPRKTSLEAKLNRASQSLATTEKLDRILQLVSTTKEDVRYGYSLDLFNSLPFYRWMAHIVHSNVSNLMWTSCAQIRVTTSQTAENLYPQTNHWLAPPSDPILHS